MNKSQINLPKTAFSMKANLPTREPEILKFWEKINLYNKKLSVDFIKFIRGEKKFKGVDHLRSQINKDIKIAKSI